MNRGGAGRRVRLGLVVGVELALLVAAGIVASAWSDRSPAADPRYQDIAAVAPGPGEPAPAPGAATGSYIWSCGHGEEGHRNTANVVVAPGFDGSPHHVHEYVGNRSTDVASTVDSLAAAPTSCPNGDRSTYYWPVLRLDTGASAEHRPIQTPAVVTLAFLGNPAGPVVAMPWALRGATGDAVAATNGAAEARASWSCAADTRRRTLRYPRCRSGDQLLRIFDFPSCWDGRRVDTPNHRAHLVFPGAAGRCPAQTFAVPRLRLTLGYALPAGSRFLIDAFPAQRNSPLTDHAFFLSLFPEPLMAEVVRCLNAGATCRPGP